MKKDENASISLIKIASIVVILIFLFSIGVRAFNTQVNNVKIILSNNYEMDVLTTKTNVGEILEENHIVVLPEETVIPGMDSDIGEDKTITITTSKEVTSDVTELAEEDENVSMEQILGNYSPIVEKIVVEKEVIPYETITKNVSDGESTTNKVIQAGVNGLKEVTYKVKYQNDIEIEKTVVSEKIIKEPVDKIVQIQTKTTSRTSSSTRSETTSTSSSSTSAVYKVTAYCSCTKCCGKSTGITASGTKATAGKTIAASSNFTFGTKIKINGTVYTVEDRGGAITGNKIDIYMSSHAQALAWGVKYLSIEVIK